jgi:hypothetical protein
MKLAAVAMLALALAASAAGAVKWKTVKSAHASGDVAAATLAATVSHPKGLAARVAGKDGSGGATVACSKRFPVSSKTTDMISISIKTTAFKGAGVHVLRLPIRGADSCDVTASAAARGAVRVTLLRR